MARKFNSDQARIRPSAHAVAPVRSDLRFTEREAKEDNYGGAIVYAGLPETIRNLIDDAEAKAGR
jgi:hypothetical protein